MSQRKYVAFLCPNGKPSFVLFPASQAHADVIHQVEEALGARIQLVGAGFYELVHDGDALRFEVYGNSQSLQLHENASATDESAQYLNSLINQMAYVVKENHLDDLAFCSPQDFAHILDKAMNGESVARGSIDLVVSKYGFETRLKQTFGGYNASSRPIFEKMVARQLMGNEPAYLKAIHA